MQCPVLPDDSASRKKGGATCIFCFTDFSKAFDVIKQNLLIVNLTCYGVTTKLLHLILIWETVSKGKW